MDKEGLKKDPPIRFEFRRINTPHQWRELLDLKTVKGLALNGYMVLFFIYHILYPLDVWTKYTSLGPDRFVILSIIFSLVLVFLFAPAKPHSLRNKIPWYDILLAIGAAVGCAYMFINNEIMAEGSEITQTGMYFGILTVLVLLEGVRRTMGWSVVIVIAIFFIYALTSNHWPGVLWSREFYFDEVLASVYLYDSGMFGETATLWAKIIVLFMVFAGLIMVSGAGKLVMELALALVGHLKGGAGKVAIIGSGGLGSIGPAGPANVALTGPVTIPMMKNAGYSAEMAGAIEAVASSAGGITPPVMGALSFFVADWLELPYYKVILGATLPALLYYATLLAMVDFHARRENLPDFTRDMFPSIKDSLKSRGHYLLPIALFVYLILALKWSIQSSVLYASLAMIIVGQFGPEEDRLTAKNILIGMQNGLHVVVQMSPIFAAIGIIMGTLEVTGMPVRFAGMVTSLAEGNLVLLLMLTAIASYILGCGMPMIASYFILATIAAPALIDEGILPIAAHWFVIWSALLHFFTPPVMPMVIVGAAISGGKLWATSFHAVRLAIAMVIVPWVFVFNPSLMLQGGHGVGETLFTLLVSLIGLIAFAGGLQGYFLERANVIQRVSLLFAGTGIISWLFYPPLGFLGVVLLIIVLVWQNGHIILMRKFKANSQKSA